MGRGLGAVDPPQDEIQQVLVHTVNSRGTDLELAQEIVTIYNTSSNYQYIF